MFSCVTGLFQSLPSQCSNKVQRAFGCHSKYHQLYQLIPNELSYGDIEYIESSFFRLIGERYKEGCDQRILDFLKQSSDELINSLAVVLISTEGNSAITYKGRRYSYHVTLMGMFNGSPFIFDPSLYQSKEKAIDWMEKTFIREEINYFLGGNEYLMESVPRFRLVAAKHFLENVSKINEMNDHVIEYFLHSFFQFPFGESSLKERQLAGCVQRTLCDLTYNFNIEEFLKLSEGVPIGERSFSDLRGINCDQCFDATSKVKRALMDEYEIICFKNRSFG